MPPWLRIPGVVSVQSASLVCLTELLYVIERKRAAVFDFSFIVNNEILNTIDLPSHLNNKNTSV